MRHSKYYISRMMRTAMCTVFSLAVISPAALALPASVDAELSALNISESEFETELGVELFYAKLQSMAERVCRSGLYQAFQSEDATALHCMPNMVSAFVNTIGHDRLLAYHERHLSEAVS